MTGSIGDEKSWQCRFYCKRVARFCPYLLPHVDHAYAGEPAFSCTGFYAESDDDDDSSSCDGPCATGDLDVGPLTICNVQRDNLPRDDLSPPGTSDDWPSTMLPSSGTTFVGCCRLMLLMLLVASLPTRRCTLVIFFDLLLYFVESLKHFRLISCCLPDTFVNR